MTTGMHSLVFLRQGEDQCYQDGTDHQAMII